MMEEEYKNLTTAYNQSYPDLIEFYSNLTPLVGGSMLASVLVLILNTTIFFITISRAKINLPTNVFPTTAILCSIYPLISMAAVLTIFFPKTWLVCSTWMHLSFTFGAIVFHNLCFRYVHSEARFLKQVGDNDVMDIKTAPCCCCCIFFPSIIPSTNNLMAVKYLIWQMPVVQSSIMIILNFIYYNDSAIYESVFIFFVPFIVASIILGLWGLNITVKMLNQYTPSSNLMRKMLCLQLILLLCKLQYFVLDKLLYSLDFGTEYPITNTIYKQIIINLLILFEMILVSLLVQNAYSKPVTL